MNQVRVEQRLVSPALASQILQANTSNRPIRVATVMRYLRDMQSNNWQCNGETIKIASDGTLLDGQHRLTAVAKLGRPVEMMIVSGLPRDAFETIDTGVRRTTSQILSMGGNKNAAVLASASRWVTLISNGCVATDISTSQQLQNIESFPELRDYAARFAGSKTLKRLAPSSIVAVCALAHRKYGAEAVKSFIDKMEIGDGLSRTDPVFLLRERCIAQGTKFAKTHADVMAALAIKAMKAHCEGRQIGTLRYRPDSEIFPTL